MRAEPRTTQTLVKVTKEPFTGSSIFIDSRRLVSYSRFVKYSTDDFHCCKAFNWHQNEVQRMVRGVEILENPRDLFLIFDVVEPKRVFPGIRALLQQLVMLKPS